MVMCSSVDGCGGSGGSNNNSGTTPNTTPSASCYIFFPISTQPPPHTKRMKNSQLKRTHAHTQTRLLSLPCVRARRRHNIYPSQSQRKFSL